MYDKIINIRVTQDEYNTLRNTSEAEGVTVSTLVRQRISEMSIPDEVGEWE